MAGRRYSQYPQTPYGYPPYMSAPPYTPPFNPNEGGGMEDYESWPPGDLYNPPPPMPADNPPEGFWNKLKAGMLDPRTRTFLVGTGAALSQPNRFGQNSIGKWGEALSHGYNSLAYAQMLQAQQAAEGRKERREDYKIGLEGKRVGLEEKRTKAEIERTGATAEQTRKETSLLDRREARLDQQLESVMRREETAGAIDLAKLDQDARQHQDSLKMEKDKLAALNTQNAERTKIDQQKAKTDEMEGKARASYYYAQAASARKDAETGKPGGEDKLQALEMKVFADLARNRVPLGDEAAEDKELRRLRDLAREFVRGKAPASATPAGPVTPTSGIQKRPYSDLVGYMQRLKSQGIPITEEAARAKAREDGYEFEAKTVEPAKKEEPKPAASAGNPGIGEVLAAPYKDLWKNVTGRF